MAEILKLLALLVILAVIYKLVFVRKPKDVLFEMHFKNGRMAQHSGKIPERFAKECRAIAKKGKLTCVIRAENSQPVTLHISANAGTAYSHQIREAFSAKQYEVASMAKAH
ncbi:DUF3634 family protein [Shewanella avicenniae]|uniref:DUF3634 family protein n=1 Tax=Shewanella avicenniae TaxID=2814294 RepID=A0ABX7QSX3_9GAMM|nr:DUF3634 family protein [Shewanella avicenniae]QSX34574.1 DUF3634 family protein [Shewanella avicenniae]